MGKKGKKGKNGKKKEKEGKKEDKMTFAEALLAFQIQIKETSIEEYLFEVKQVEEKNKRYKERNERLKAEQLGHIRDLLKEAKEQDKQLAKKEVVNREQVDQAIKKKWEFIRNEQHTFEEMRSQINQLVKDIVEKESEKDYWLTYKNVGSQEHAKQIQLLEMEICNIKQNFEDIKEHFRQSLDLTKNKINVLAEKEMDEQKELATENAIQHIDKCSRKEIKENIWLKNEVTLYRKDVSELEVAVQDIEQGNLKLISQLFDCRLQDLKISRNCFLTQVAGLDVPADGLLGEDLADLERMEESEDELATPKRVRLLAAEKKVFSVEAERDVRETEQETSEQDQVSDYCLSQELNNILYGDDNDFQAYLQLGPLELKLLSIVGQRMPIHKEVIRKPSKGQLQDGLDQTQLKCPITYKMIKSALL